MTVQAKELTILTNEQILNEVNTIRNNSIVNDTISDDDLKEFIKSGKDISEIITRSEQNAYTKEWRSARKNINSRINTSFENSLNLSKCKNVYVDSMIVYATLEAKKSYISSLASLSTVEKVDLLIKDSVELDDLIDEETVESTTTPLGYHMFQSKLPTNYDGLGVKIGVLEFTIATDSSYFVYYDENNVHLADKEDDITIRIDPEMDTSKISEAPDEHATTVLAVLCGNPVESTDGIYYSGVAPAADIYYTNVLTNITDGITNFADGLTWLVLDNNVSVINISAGDDGIFAYCDLDKYVDCLIAQYRVSVVVACGNDGSYIAHPAMANNAITVGYVDNPNVTTGLYTAHNSSSYNQYAGNTNKPDIVSYGQNIYMLNNDHSVDSTPPSGTSVATPIVTGTVALMLQANPSLENNPDKIKAILLTSANNEQIDKNITNDGSRWGEVSYINSYLTSAESVTRNRTGAGLINIKAAVSNAIDSITLSYDFSSITSITTGEYYIPSNVKMKIGLIFEKIDHDIPNYTRPYGTRVDFEMININNGDVVLSSIDLEANSYSKYDNVKVFDIETAKTGTYVFRIYCSAFDNSDTSTNTTSPTIHTNPHSKVNATLAITCSCLNPITSSDDINYTSDSVATLHSCNNVGCIYVCIGEIEYCQRLVENEIFGTVTHILSHKRTYSNGVVIYNENIDFYISLNDATKTYRTFLAEEDVIYNQYGYIEYYKYEVYLYDSNGKFYDVYITDVYIQYENEMARIFLYP